MIQLKQTPLATLHRNLGARMVDFGGWDMPVQYAGILAEHEAVRTRAGPVRCQPHGRDLRVKGTGRSLSRLADAQCGETARGGADHYHRLPHGSRDVRG